VGYIGRFGRGVFNASPWRVSEDYTTGWLIRVSERRGTAREGVGAAPGKMRFEKITDGPRFFRRSFAIAQRRVPVGPAKILVGHARRNAITQHFPRRRPDPLTRSAPASRVLADTAVFQCLNNGFRPRASREPHKVRMPNLLSAASLNDFTQIIIDQEHVGVWVDVRLNDNAQMRATKIRTQARGYTALTARRSTHNSGEPR
jgi:hypothetical protein